MPTPFVDPELESLKEVIRKEEQKTRAQVSQIQQNVNLPDLIDSILTDGVLKTMSISYDPVVRVCKLQVIKDNMSSVICNTYKYAVTPEDYKAFCHDRLKVDTEAEYNNSSDVIINGTHVRVYTTLKPYADYPHIVISTTKEPPEKIDTLSARDEEILSEVLLDNFIVVGQSGAGKTYLLNYLLKKYYPAERRVGMFQEFAELKPPNEFTDCFTVPPSKPGQQYSHLEHLVQCSNLQRYDSIFVGEIKGSEAWPFVCNLASGTSGGATVHGVDAQSALQRLRILCLLSRVNLSEKAVDYMIAKSLNYVVTVEDGKLRSIEKLLTTNNGKFSLERIAGSKDDYNTNGF